MPTGAVGDPPEHLLPSQAAIWRELAAYGFWLTEADRLLLEVAVCLASAMRAGTLDGSGIAKLISALAKLGFTPTDRSKVQMPSNDEPDPADEFFN